MSNFDKFYGKDSDSFYYPEPSSVLEKYIDLISGENLTALDLGCGDGRNAIFAAKKNFQVSCCDLSQSAIEKIRKIAIQENLKISAQVEDVNRLHFENSNFDLIIASTIFDHLEKDDCKKLIANAKQWLKLSGFIYVGVFTVDDPAYKIRHGLLPESEKGMVSETGDYIKTFFEKNELKECFSEFKEIYYYEGLKEDLTHGNPHFHGLARIVCQKIK